MEEKIEKLAKGNLFKIAMIHCICGEIILKVFTNTSVGIYSWLLLHLQNGWFS